MNPPPKFLKADAPVTVWLHIEKDGRAEHSIPARHRTHLGRVQVHIHGKWRNVPKRGYFEYADGAVGRLEIIRKKVVDIGAGPRVESRPTQREIEHVQTSQFLPRQAFRP